MVYSDCVRKKKMFKKLGKKVILTLRVVYSDCAKEEVRTSSHGEKVDLEVMFYSYLARVLTKY